MPIIEAEPHVQNLLTTEHEPTRRDAGFTTVEALIGAMILTVSFLAVAGAFSTNVIGVGRAKATQMAAAFLDATLDNLRGQTYDAVLAMNGNTFYDQLPVARSRFQTHLVVWTSSPNLLQIDATLTDTKSGGTLTRVTAFRSKR